MDHRASPGQPPTAAAGLAFARFVILFFNAETALDGETGPNVAQEAEYCVCS